MIRLKEPISVIKDKDYMLVIEDADKVRYVWGNDGIMLPFRLSALNDSYNGDYGLIYKATNLNTKMIYVGQTIDNLSDRINNHYYTSRYGKSAFHRELQNTNKDDWDWVVLESNVYIKKLSVREKFYIDKYNSIEDGYNQLKNDQGRRGGRIHELYHPSHGIISGNGRFLSEKIGTHQSRISTLIRDKISNIKGWVLLKYKNEYEYKMIERNGKVYELFHDKHGLVEGKTGYFVHFYGLSSAEVNRVVKGFPIKGWSSPVFNKKIATHNCAKTIIDSDGVEIKGTKSDISELLGCSSTYVRSLFEGSIDNIYGWKLK